MSIDQPMFNSASGISETWRVKETWIFKSSGFNKPHEKGMASQGKKQQQQYLGAATT